ncbi:MAG TPA: sigma-54-dependent Fis family transcriptional regulator, partial [Polyangiaceae bacterium]|nr:sigma-54-dependent Fis family transcriptional regulator [Polyangiaceae bacterium]
LVARIRDTGQPLLVSDLAQDADLAMAASLQASSTRAVMCAPVTLDERVIGALYVGSSRPFSRAHLELLTLYAHHAVHVVAAAERDRTLTAELARVERQPPSALVGGSPAMTAVATQIRKVASHDIGVLIAGETGTGKEVVAREIHRIGARSDAPFVAVNCGAIAEGLFESEMFGHKKGAFTHAYQDRAGWIRRAHGGTLFLDEIGELTPAHQAKLLRVLQERVVTPVGGEQSHEVDFRLLCATNRDLDREGSFRRDLFYRIAGVCISLPPLRDRDEDVIELAHHFLRRHGDSLGRRELRFSAAALTAMRKYAWPGNVRELEAAVRKAIVLCEGDALMPTDLGLAHVEPSREILPLAVVRDRHLKRYVQDVVDRLHGNRAEAAKQLMVSVRTVFKYLEEV